MKLNLKPNQLPLLSLGLGGIGLALRWVLYAVAVDAKNLLPVLHPLEILLWLLTVAAAAVIISMVWKLEGSNRYVDNFTASTVSAVGCFAAAAGILVTVLTAKTGDAHILNHVCKALGILSAPALVLAGVSRMQGKRPLFLCHCVVCMYFALHLVSRYQIWSGNPQLQDYFYSLAGCALLMLFGYYQAAFDVGSGKRRMQLAIGLLAAFACFVAVSNTDCPLMYLTGGIWTLTNICTLTPVPRRQKKEAPEQTKE